MDHRLLGRGRRASDDSINSAYLDLSTPPAHSRIDNANSTFEDLDLSDSEAHDSARGNTAYPPVGYVSGSPSPHGRLSAHISSPGREPAAPSAPSVVDRNNTPLLNHAPPLDQESTNAPSTTKPGTKKTWYIRVSNLLLWASATVPLIAFIIWLVFTVKGLDKLNIFIGEAIGGRLSQPAAKAIDFLCSALLAPLLMVPFNYIWFGKARTYTINEQRSRSGVPLSVLAEASSTSSGAYDPAKLYILCSGKTWRLLLLGMLTLLSALSKTAFSNMIAYESYTVDVRAAQPVTLRMLQDRQVNHTSAVPANLSMYGFDIQQQTTVSNQMTALLGALNMASAVGKLSENETAYIGINATSSSLDAIAGSISAAQDIPAYRLSVDCAAHKPTDLEVTHEGKLLVWFGGTGFTATFPKSLKDMSVDGPFPYAAFTDSAALLGFYVKGVVGDQSFSSPFGEVQAAWSGGSWNVAEGPKFSSISTWGVNCSIMQQDGAVNYTRSSGGSEGWVISGTRWSPERRVVPSFLSDWQANINYQAPNTSDPGIGPALARTAKMANASDNADGKHTDWAVFAANYLYASAEAQRITYEVAASNASRDEPSYFYTVPAIEGAQFYRITYIPSLLLAGLACAFTAAAVTIGMAVYARNTRSAQECREVDVLRLVADVVAGLQDDAGSIATVATWPKDKLEKWAEKYRVGYSETTENGKVVLRLLGVEGGEKAQ